MMKCRDVTELTSDYLSKKLSFYERLQFRIHLFICNDCRRFVKQFDVAVKAIRRLTTFNTPTKPNEKQVDALLSEFRSRQHDKKT